MIRNGIYLATTRFLDGVEAYNRHVMVLRDGTMRGGGGFYYTVGSYTCSDGKWKGEMTSREHSPIAGTYPWARKEISIGFTGTYSDDGAEFDATALAGKRSFRFKSIYLLLADGRSNDNDAAEIKSGKKPSHNLLDVLSSKRGGGDEKPTISALHFWRFWSSRAGQL